LREASFDYYLHFHWEVGEWKLKEVSWNYPGATTSVWSAGTEISGNVERVEKYRYVYAILLSNVGNRVGIISRN
jgi:hypothetical protein